MLQQTARRVGAREKFEPLVVVGNALHADAVERQLAEIEASVATLILEPSARNTAAAIALAILSVPDDAVLLVLPSDHLIADVPSFLDAVERGQPFADEGWIVTFGIRADRPETGYGYIRQGALLAPGVFSAAEFVEKPDAETAAAFVAGGAHHWNGGIFMFRADVMRRAFERHAPDILEAVAASLDRKVRSGVRIQPDAALFASARSQSIDHAIMEHADRIVVIPVDIGWSDVGSWDALADCLPADENRNVIEGDVVAVDSRNCMLRSEGRLVVVAGVSDLIVVETQDAIIVLPRGESQRAKQAVEALKARGHPALDHNGSAGVGKSEEG